MNGVLVDLTIFMGQMRKGMDQEAGIAWLERIIEKMRSRLAEDV